MIAEIEGPISIELDGQCERMESFGVDFEPSAVSERCRDAVRLEGDTIEACSARLRKPVESDGHEPFPWSG